MQRIHVFASLLLCACAARANSGPASAPPTPAARAPAQSVAPPAPPPPGPDGQILVTSVSNHDKNPYIGVIDRDGLNAVIEQGLGRVLARLRVSPVMDRGHFQGFRVTGLDPAWKGAGIMLEDIITRLNGQSIERPEQAQVAFESLRVASEISLELMREGKPKKLRYRIESRNSH